MYHHTGYAYKSKESTAHQREAQERGKKKIEGKHYQVVSTYSTPGQYYFTIQFDDVNIDITEEEVACTLANMCFGGKCSKVAPGKFELMEYTD